MKITLIADQLSVPSPADVYPGAPERRVLPLASALAGHGHEVTVYARRQSAARGHAADSPGVNIELVDAGPRRPLPGELVLPHIAVFADQLADRWRRGAPDIVHAQSWTSGVAAVAGARGLAIPMVVTLAPTAGDGRRPPAADTGARERMEASLTHSVQAVLADSSHEGTRLSRLAASRGAAPSASVRVLPPGVDTETFCPEGPAAARGDRPRLLVVAPPGDEPGLATVLHALAELPNVELVVAGGPARGRLRRDPGYRALTGLARQLGVAGRLTCTGAVREADMPALMRSADVLVHLTGERALAMIPVEAMACGTPVVAAEDSSQPDAVIHENTGFLVPPGNPAQLVRRIRQLLANPMLLDGYGIAAARRAADRFSWDRIGQETLAVYTALLGPRVPVVA
jgi:glycosyltransferase involved in cell wall biosynthesis